MNSKKNIFFTSDWHIGHVNSIEFDNRPFKDIDHMHEVLINNFNSSVREQDVTYFLGDMGLTNGDAIQKVVSRLNGTKVAVIGNHDKGPNSLYNMGFDVVLYGGVLYIAQERVTFSHCPLMGVWRENTMDMKGAAIGEYWHGESREKSKWFSFEDEGQFHLHGHIHSRKDRDRSKKIQGRQIDVGVPANNYRPVSMSSLESLICRIKREEGE